MAIQTLQTLAQPAGASNPNSLELQRAYAKALLNPDHVAPPIQSWTQGVAGIVDALVGGTVARKAGEKEDARTTAQNSQYADLATALIGGSGMPSADPSGQGLVSQDGGDAGGALDQGQQQPMVSQDQIRAFLASDASPDLKSKVLELWKAQVSPAPHDYMAVDGSVFDKNSGMFVAKTPLKPTTDIQDFQYGEDHPDFYKYQLDQKKAGAINLTNNLGPTGIDYGKPEEGYAWKRDPEGKVAINDKGAPIQVPIGGGSVEAKAADESAKKAAGLATTATQGNVVLEDVDRALQLASQAPSATGFGGWLSSGIADTPAANLKEILQSIKSNIAFDRLQQMRQNSPTGGALGNVSDNDMKMLQASMGSLEQSQSKEQFVQNLQRVRNIFMDIVHGPGGAAGGNMSRLGAGSAIPTQPVVIDGYTITPAD